MLNELIKGKAYDLDGIAEFLKANPEKIKEFEESYRKSAIDWKKQEENLFEKNSREASTETKQNITSPEESRLSEVKERIVQNLVHDTCFHLRVKDNAIQTGNLLGKTSDSVTKEELNALPADIRPQCTEKYALSDLAGSSGLTLLQIWMQYLKESDPVKKQSLYQFFRQGMDILDLDEVLYKMLDQNPNSMSHWLPGITCANAISGCFFRIPETVIVKVPLPVLQLTRIAFDEINQTTKDIVNEWAKTVFHLQTGKKYFIKTGTYSSKFDFRNAKVADDKEVMEIGEYLLYIQFQAQQMAAPLTKPVIYGASTTTEWVVREYIEDKEGNPTIYKGLPLHTEYRVFVDFDRQKVLGVLPYWEPNTMKRRFMCGAQESPHDFHDYIIYKAHEPVLMQRYYQNEETVKRNMKRLVKNANLTGQWSVDIMQNGDEFWLIDMATADTSALKELIPYKITDRPVNWIGEAGKLLSGQDI